MEAVRPLIPLLLMGSIFLTSLALGLQSTWRDVTYLLRRPAVLVRSLVAMNVLTPLAALLLLGVSHVPAAVKVAVVVLTVAPVPPMLPAAQLKLGGRGRYVYGLLVTSALLSTLIVPLTIELIGRFSAHGYAISPLAVARSVGVSVLLPVLCGLAVHALWPKLARRAQRPLALVANIGLVLSLLPVMIVSAPGALALIGNGNVLVIAAVVLAALALGHALGGPEPVDRTTLALACAVRHPGVALAIVKANVAELHAGAALVLFLVIGALVTLPYKRWRMRQALGAPAPSH